MTVYVMMGVAGCGKTTIGTALAERLGCPFYDGDNFHPPANVAKMASGTPLNDADRQPWLTRLHDLIEAHSAKGETAVLACSALKQKYRHHLQGDNNDIIFVFLQGSFDVIWQRLKARSNHYMKAEMLQSQFEALEEPASRTTLLIDIREDKKQIIETILHLAHAKSNE